MKFEKSKISIKSGKSKIPKTIKDIEDTLKEMDRIHNTSFYDWIKDENNASVIAFKTKDLFQEHYENQPELVYNALRFLCKDWKLSKIAELILKLFYKTNIASEKLAIIIYEVSLLLENPEKVDLISLLLIGEEPRNVAFFLYHFFQYTEKKYRENTEILNEEEFLDEMNSFCSGILECLFSCLKWNNEYFKELVIEYIMLSTLEIDARREFLIRMVNVKYSRFQQELQDRKENTKSKNTKINSSYDHDNDNEHHISDNDNKISNNEKINESEEVFKRSLNFGILIFNMFQIVMRTDEDDLLTVSTPTKETYNKTIKDIIINENTKDEITNDNELADDLLSENSLSICSNKRMTLKINEEQMKKEESSTTLWMNNNDNENDIENNNDDNENKNDNENSEDKGKMDEEGEVHESGSVQNSNQKKMGGNMRNNKMNMYGKPNNKRMYPNNKMPYGKRNMNMNHMNRMYPMGPMNRPMLRNLNQKIYINPKFGLIGNNDFNNQFMRYDQPIYGNMNMMGMNPMNPMMQPMMPMNPMGYPEHQRFFNPYGQNFQRPPMGYENEMYGKRPMPKDKMMNPSNKRMYYDKQDGGRSSQNNNNNNNNNSINNGNNKQYKQHAYDDYNDYNSDNNDDDGSRNSEGSGSDVDNESNQSSNNSNNNNKNSNNRSYSNNRNNHKYPNNKSSSKYSEDYDRDRNNSYKASKYSNNNRDRDRDRNRDRERDRESSKKSSNRRSDDKNVSRKSMSKRYDDKNSSSKRYTDDRDYDKSNSKYSKPYSSSSSKYYNKHSNNEEEENYSDNYSDNDNNNKYSGVTHSISGASTRQNQKSSYKRKRSQADHDSRDDSNKNRSKSSKIKSHHSHNDSNNESNNDNHTSVEPTDSNTIHTTLLSTSSKIFIRNLSPNTTKSTLVDLAKSEGNLRHISFNPDDLTAEITFNSKDSAVLFRRKYNRYMLDGSNIVISFK